MKQWLLTDWHVSDALNQSNGVRVHRNKFKAVISQRPSNQVLQKIWGQIYIYNLYSIYDPLTNQLLTELALGLYCSVTTDNARNRGSKCCSWLLWGELQI